MIRFEQVSKVYQMGTNKLIALNHVDLHIQAGELTAIIGPSGSGKSTCMNILGLLDKPTSGQYFLDGLETASFSLNQQASFRNKTIGFIFQSFFLLPKMTALQNVSLPLLYRQEAKSTVIKKSKHVLDQMGMLDHASHRPNELSGGQQQRVAIARALVGSPKIILADEPTGALDTVTSQKVMDLLLHVNRDRGVTVIIITHDPAVAKECSRVIQIQDGEILE